MTEKCPECGAWWTGPSHRCPPIITTNSATTTVHHIERPEDYLSPGELVLLAEEAAEHMVLTLSAEEWDWLQERLAEEPRVLPRLRKLLEGLAEEAEPHCGTCQRLRNAIDAAIDSLTRWNGDDGSLVVAANIRHLQRALEESL